MLVVRPDRLGDLVLTLPMIGKLARDLRIEGQAPEVELLLSPGPASLAPAIPGSPKVLLDPGGLLPLAGRLRDRHYRCVVFPFATARLASAAWLAGIPRRIGNGLRVYSPLFTDRVRLHRSRPPVHETDYCLRLLDPLGLPLVPAPPPTLVSPETAREQAGELLANAGLASQGFVVVHPGGGGSAGRPTPEDFARFAQAARDAALPEASILVSFGPGEREQAERTAEGCEGSLLPEATDLVTYQALVARAGLFLAGSTGPLHLAAASQVPTLGFYPWKQSQTAERWGPRGERVASLSPPKAPCRACEEGSCTDSACFARITLDEVAQQARGIVPGS